ncbi:MAG: fibrobacter succinogenes major paralogous domain-containing protein [Bacteroidota bacterium]
MKKNLLIVSKVIFLLFTYCFLLLTASAQTPQKMSYQAVIRNNNNQLVPNHAIGMQISILQGSPGGTAVYTEKQTPNTNANGLITIEIGGGIGFDAINWANDIYFIKTETDPLGGTDYTITGTSQLLSVPYALHAKTAENLSKGITETDPVFGESAAKVITSTNITNWNTAYDWGNHTGLYRPISYVPAWSEITSKPTLTTVATSGSYSDLINLPTLTNGTVTSVTGTSPITVTTGTTTPVISMTQANGTANGYLSSTDWTTFNNKSSFDGTWVSLSGKPTSIAGYGITDAVATTGNQTIAGNKTFSGTTTVITPVNATDAVNKAYVDAIIEQLYAQGALRVKDNDGNYYNTIKIGNQIWMAENLKTTKYRNGDLIGTTSTPALDISGETEPKYQWANDGNETNVATYGRLYTYYAVVDSRSVCPTGWHVPTDAEWTTLTEYLTNNSYGYEGSGDDIAKSVAATSGWTTDPTAGTVGNDQTRNNSCGFTALPGGARSNDGTYQSVGDIGFWWSSTQYETPAAYYWQIYYNFYYVLRNHISKLYGFSVRCLRD